MLFSGPETLERLLITLNAVAVHMVISVERSPLCGNETDQPMKDNSSELPWSFLIDFVP